MQVDFYEEAKCAFLTCTSLPAKRRVSVTATWPTCCAPVLDVANFAAAIA